MNTYTLLALTALTLPQISLFCMDKQLTQRRKTSAEETLPRYLAMQLLKADTCGFCQEQLSIHKGALVTLPCEHTYHSTCIDTLKAGFYTTCIICRGPFEKFDDENENDTHCCMGCTRTVFETLRESSVSYENLITQVIFDFTSPHVTWPEIFQKISEASEQCAEEHAIN